jgi:hypothetical protein
MVTNRNGFHIPSGLELGLTFYTDLGTDLNTLDAALAKCNWAATIDPTVSNDSSQGYVVGSHWYNTTGNTIFIAKSVGVGAAVWTQIYPTVNANLSITNAMLAGSITFAKLLGSDISITNTQLAGSITFAKLLGSDISITNTQLAGSISQDKLSGGILNSQLAASDGWIASGETWTYASAAAPNYTFTIATDKTTKYSPGMRIKLTDNSAVKYFIVVKVAYSNPNTTITVYGGTDYTLAGGAISATFYSMMNIPAGFPMDKTKWQIVVSNATTATQASPTSDVWYNLGTINIPIPIGAWRVSWKDQIQATRAASGALWIFATLSTANNSESNTSFTQCVYVLAETNVYLGSYMSLNILVAAATTYYLNTKASGANCTAIYANGAAPAPPTLLIAECAYI